MPGGGIKTDITVPDAKTARLLDLSRLASRAGRTQTGIDRVELAYLRAFLADSEPVYGLVRSAWGYLLLDRQGCHFLLERVTTQRPWGRADLLSRLRRNLDPMRQRAEADLRRVAMDRCLPSRLSKMLLRHLPQGTAYVNVGHTNLTERVLIALKQSLHARVVVMIHDTIPLDFPQYQRHGTVEMFRAMLDRVQRHASLILCNSACTRDDVIRHMAPRGTVPETLVVWLGISEHAPDPDFSLPAGYDPNRPAFITIGTIEPRKNHMFLLDLWAEMARDMDSGQVPQLLICGARGWNNADVFARLDSDPLVGLHVFEVAGLTDAQIAALLPTMCGALFPSHAEGFGLPPAEALAAGVPIICNRLDVYIEILGDNPVYAKVRDGYLWRQEIERLTSSRSNGQITHRKFQPPTWQAHFNAVLSRL
jgi:glycosyltransferase involved in cell wall biosynthesis